MRQSKQTEQAEPKAAKTSRTTKSAAKAKPARDTAPRKSAKPAASAPAAPAEATGIEALRKSPTMARLMDALEAGTDVGHYGRLTFVMVARHFLDDDELVRLLADQPGQDEARARAEVLQVKQRDYNPPKRERILEWQAQQDFAIIADPEDPSSGNVYRELKFPDGIYDHINQYHVAEAKAEADGEK